MMDFLQSLAPREIGDRTRAVAALPSRFADSPLHALPLRASRAIDMEPPAIVVQDDIADSPTVRSTVHEERRAPHGAATRTDRAAMSPRASAHPRAGPSPLRSEASRPSSARAWQGHALFDEVAVAPRPHMEQGTEPVSAAAGRPATSSTSPRVPDARKVVSHAHTVQPLSEAAVAGRLVTERRDADEIVHVTIGRIDVVGDPRSAAPPRASRPPRTPSVALADYLHRDRQQRP